MTCVAVGSVTMCSVGGITYRTYNYCPVCERRRRFIARWEPWYGVDFTCLGCGDSWQDGYLLPRPFRPRWRKEAVASAKQRWASAPPRDEARRAMRAEVDAYLRPVITVPLPGEDK